MRQIDTFGKTALSGVPSGVLVVNTAKCSRMWPAILGTATKTVIKQSIIHCFVYYFTLGSR